MNWRVIPLETHDAATNLATDEAIMEAGQPTVRFYTWKPAAVSIGFFQSLDQVDAEKYRSNGMDVVRRQTGGGIIFHGRDISYSIIAPESYFPRKIIESYQLIGSYVVNTLKILGINATAVVNNITVDDKLISMSAQTRKENILLQHGSIFYNSSPDSSISLTQLGNFTIETVYHALVRGFTSGREFVFGHKTAEENAKMRHLTAKYSSHEWLARR